MLRYLKNFLSVVTWLNKTNKLCPSRDFTANINDLNVVCGSYYENYFYQQIRQDTNEQETDAEFIYRKKTDFNREFGVAIKTAHLYLGDKKLRELNGDEKKITAALNLGCAENYYLTNKEVVPKEQCVLVVGVIDFLSDYCMKRIATMDDVVSPPPGGLYTIGSRPIKKPLSVHTLTHSDQLRNNLFLGWDSPVLFPTLAHKFPTNIVFQEIYVDDLVDVDMVSFRGATMRDFYEQLLPQLRSAMLIGDETTAHIPFATEAMVALHASWRAVEKYATITFVKKNVGCEWKTRTSDDTNEDLKASKNTNATDANMSTAYNQVGVCRATLLSDINKCKLGLEANKKKRKRNPNANGNVECVDTKAITSLVLAGTQWSKCTDEAVDDIGWIKMQFKKEVNMTEHIVKYPINNTENVTNDPPLDNGIASSLDLSCNLQNLEEFSQFLEDVRKPRINLEFKDKTSKSVESIVVSKSLTIAGVVPTEYLGFDLLNHGSQYTPELLARFKQQQLEEMTRDYFADLLTNPNPYNRIEPYSQELRGHHTVDELHLMSQKDLDDFKPSPNPFNRNVEDYSDKQREWAKIEVLNNMSQIELDDLDESDSSVIEKV